MKFLAWHLGLGDAIAFADLAVRIADGGPMLVPCYAHNVVSVKSLFVNHPNIGICDPMDPVIVKFGIEKKDIVNLGHYSGVHRKEGEDMVEWVYRTAGMDPTTRFDSDVVANAAKSVDQHYICAHCSLRHEDAKRGFVIDRNRFRGSDLNQVDVMNDGTSILRFAKFIKNAPMIDCIDSSFLHLVEQLWPTGKLFYHKYARPHSESYRTLRHNWTVIE